MLRSLEVGRLLFCFVMFFYLRAGGGAVRKGDSGFEAGSALTAESPMRGLNS